MPARYWLGKRKTSRDVAAVDLAGDLAGASGDYFLRAGAGAFLAASALLSLPDEPALPT